MHSAQLPLGAISLRRTLKKAQFLAGDVLVRSCAFDWRACQSGDTYFALTTADGDGHEAAPQAIERGATAVVAERLLPLSVPQVLVPDSRVALGRVCQALAGHPSRALTTIGITGSAGKSCTAMLLASILEAAGQTAGVMSSLGHSDSLAQSPPPETTPTPAEFADWLRRMQLARCGAGVLELSSEALAERRTSGIALDLALVTNIKNVPLSRHNTAAAYRKVTRRIFNLLKKGGVAILNADDHRSRGWCSDVQGIASPLLTYAMHSGADVTASVLERFASEQTFLLTVGSHSAPVRTHIVGDAHVYNCLAAAASAVALGLDLTTIVGGLEAVERLPGRMERVECGQAFSVYIDAASSPEALAQAIKSLRQTANGRVWTVFGTALETDPARRALLGRTLERGSHKTILTSADPLEAATHSTMHDYLDGFEKSGRAHVMPNRKRAIQYALANARPGDAVLIAGRDDRGAACDLLDDARIPDRQIAADCLYGRSVGPDRPRFRVVG